MVVHAGMDHFASNAKVAAAAKILKFLVNWTVQVEGTRFKTEVSLLLIHSRNCLLLSANFHNSLEAKGPNLMEKVLPSSNT